MTSRTPSERPSRTDPGSDADGHRPRGLQTVAYVAATALGGIGALVVAVVELVSPDASLFDVLVWGALAILLLGAAAHRWWFGGRAEERSHLVAVNLGRVEVADAERSSSGEIDTVRRLRSAHPRLGLRDAYELVKLHGTGNR
ncbi:hypothetical protein [Rhodococcus sp. IEGM 1408]|uniref:hypothetical protein n=1 Tax=Rhodococcus sp. IEGM 1408 TaxID=3082220 RepID=UPI002954EA61|nr:hypothetical protein [Rhodococcus sp. IEGM 1408]MDV8000171.1 hypothetical protein [Rhodococcus sp. IEGM 1408]